MLSKSTLLILCFAAVAAGGYIRRSVDEHAAHSHSHPPLPVNIDWLTEEQHTQLDNEGSDVLSLVAKVRTFYDGLAAGDTKQSAARKIVHQCYRWLPGVTTKEERAELKTLHHTDHNQCKVKCAEYIGRLPEMEQTELRKYWNLCEHVSYDSHVDIEPADNHEHHSVAHHLSDQPAASRRRRDDHDHSEHTLDDAFKTHLSWLTDEQKEALRTLKGEGKSRGEILAKVMEYFKATEGTVKEQATALLQGGCRELFAKVVGSEKAAEIKTLKESGASPADIRSKADALLAEVEDPKGKKIVKEYGPACKAVFGVSEPATTRRRRDHHEGHEGHIAHHGQHTLDDYFKTHLSWLTDEQKEALRTLNGEGKGRSEIQAKVMEYYGAAEGDVKKQASELLKGGCRELLASIVGAEKAMEVKTLKESGASLQVLSKKVDALLAEVTDEHKKGMAAEYGPYCKKIFNVEAEPIATRRRRAERQAEDDNAQQEDQYNNQNDDQGARSGGSRRPDYDPVEHHSSWLTDEQKDKLREHKEGGADDAGMHSKVLDFFHVSGDDVKEMARGLLTSGCEKLLGSTFGEDKAEELRRVRNDEGAEVYQERIQEYAGELPDEGQRAQAIKSASVCRKIFEMLVRRRRNNE